MDKEAGVEAEAEEGECRTSFTILVSQNLLASRVFLQSTREHDQQKNEGTKKK